MRYCTKCGNQLSDEEKFCTKCGTPVADNQNTNDVKNVESNKMVDNIEENIKENNNVNKNSNEQYKSKASKGKIALIFIIILIIMGGIGTGVYFYTISKQNVKVEKSIEIKEVDSKSYPTVSCIVEAKNLDDEILPDNIAIKENESFVKDIAVEKAGDNRYLISYASPSKNSGKNLTVNLEYTNDNGDDLKCSTSYTAPEIKEDKSGSDSSAVNTYDPNTESIKSVYSSFIQDFIYMVNNHNISYINDYIVIGSNLYNDYTTTIDSYKKQDITEKLEGYTIQDVKKIDNSHYEVHVHESYYINYGEEHSSKIKTFNAVYTVQKDGNTFKFTDLRYED